MRLSNENLQEILANPLDLDQCFHFPLLWREVILLEGLRNALATKLNNLLDQALISGPEILPDQADRVEVLELGEIIDALDTMLAQSTSLDQVGDN